MGNTPSHPPNPSLCPQTKVSVPHIQESSIARALERQSPAFLVATEAVSSVRVKLNSPPEEWLPLPKIVMLPWQEVPLYLDLGIMPQAPQPSRCTL